jgi:hypothetical protein
MAGGAVAPIVVTEAWRWSYQDRAAAHSPRRFASRRPALARPCKVHVARGRQLSTIFTLAPPLDRAQRALWLPPRCCRSPSCRRPLSTPRRLEQRVPPHHGGLALAKKSRSLFLCPCLADALWSLCPCILLDAAMLCCHGRSGTTTLLSQSLAAVLCWWRRQQYRTTLATAWCVG